MVHVFGSRTAGSPVDGPIRIECEQVGKLAQLGASLRFPPADSLPGVFDHLLACRYELGGVDSPAMYRGTRELQLETSVLRVDVGSPVASPLGIVTLFLQSVSSR